MSISISPIEVDEKSISDRIKSIGDGQYEYVKKGHGLITTDRPLSAIRLELAMDDLGVSQTKMHSETGVAQPIISRFISGKITKTHHINTMANYLGVSANWLLGDEPNDINVKLSDNTLRIGTELFILVSNYEHEHNSDLNNADENKSNADLNIQKGRENKTMISANLLAASTNYGDLRFVIASDKSNDPDIKFGASVTFDISKTDIISGDYYAIQHGSTPVSIRKLYLEPNGDIRARACRSDFPEHIFASNDDQFKVLGRVLFITNAL